MKQLFFSYLFLLKTKERGLYYSSFVNAKKDRHLLLRLSMFVLMALVNPFFAIKRIRFSFKRYASQLNKFSKVKLVFHLLKYGVLHSIYIKDFFVYKLYIKNNRTNVLRYIYTNSISQIMSYLNNYTSTKPLGDKVVFQELCLDKNIKTPFTYIVINNNSSNFLENLPKNKDLFIKPTNGFQSRGISTIKNKKGNWYCNNQQVNAIELQNIIFANRKYKDYLVQEKLINHTKLLSLSDTDVCTLRIITGNKNNKNIEYFTSIFIIPIPEKNYFDRNKNFHVSPVNEYGIIGEAFFGSDIINTYANHKFNNAQIAGLQLPFWQEAVDMSIKIHNQLKQFRFVAWDIVLTDNGAVMLEGNHSWGTAPVQRAHQKSMYDLGFWDFIEDKV